MALDPRIASRLKTFGEVLDEISQLEQRAKHPTVQWELSATATRLQNRIAFLRDKQDEIDSSNVLDLVDEEIARAKGDVAFVTTFLDDNGLDAAWPK